ncbi:spinster family MFS transporter [Caulobacter soli]|uniref:spinster family MFS transporter n=1 Tax=Caulobacter soli TaxID=2708539 RepID=UPI0013EA0C51|nr:MFS transporter [Caulobacter soli]
MRSDFTRKPWYSSYVLLIVGLVSVMNYYDRFLLTILVEPIKRDLHITDAQVGLLAGIGFALMYSVLGVPMARLADRHGRAKVLAGVVGFWSLMTAASGMTINFATMLLARAGVGVGEAGGLPTVHALIADYFSPKRRGFALSLMGVCGAIGMSLALVGGGLINDWHGWRMAFYLAAIPGVILALLVIFTVKEPLAHIQAQAADKTAPPLGAAFKTLWGRKAFVLLCAGMAVGAVGAYAHQTWIPAFLMRTYHLTAGQVGAQYSAVTGPTMIVAILLGGLINDWLLRRDKRAPLWIIAASFSLSVPASLAFFLVRDLHLALGLSIVMTLAGGLWTGPAYAVVQSLAGPKLRALTAAIFMMIVNIVGLGLGPLVGGLLSDAFVPHFGAESLKASLCALTLCLALAVPLFLLATRTLDADTLDAES